MIPWKLWFSGIRDYENTSMDLSGQQEHVLITGPNGAGKSTITYCIGAVLYSSKVDPEGLKSRNLAAEQTWKAHIRLLFKNEGTMRIDAPDFVQFALFIVQEPGQPMKKEFVVSTGDNMTEWEEETRYTSGDRQFNFTAYKKDLQYKYKIDPDLFYLIWYQQEVNQFAVMHPEERFRIFAEMHGIDQAQRHWEESMEKLKETQETLRAAEIHVANKKHMVKLKRAELEQYEDNQRRLLEGGTVYARSLLQLETYYKNRQVELQGEIEHLKIAKENQEELIQTINTQKKAASLRIMDFQMEVDRVQAELAQIDEQRGTIETEIQATKAVIVELEQELQEVSKEKERITRTEEEVKEQLKAAILSQDELNRQDTELTSDIKGCEDTNQELMGEISRLQAAIEHDQEWERIHQERLREYVSSYHVQEQLNRLEQNIHLAKDKLHEVTLRARELDAELARLAEEQDWSKRQVESLAYFEARGIRAYALRDLVELSGSAQLKSEDRFNAMKYTIFYDGNAIAAANDLYHVSLRKVVPDRSVTELPTLQLRVKEGLEQSVFPHAVKALWWVEQFFKDSDIRIENGIIVDRMGFRGPQEQHRYILSARALLARKEEVARLSRELLRKREELEESIRQDTKRVQELNTIIQSVREAEAFMTKEYERTRRILKHKEEAARREELAEHIRGLRQAKQELTEKRIKLDIVLNELQGEAEFYVRLGQQKEKFEVLSAKQRHLESLTKQKKERGRQQDSAQDQWDRLEDLLRKQNRELQSLNDKQEQEEGTLRQMSRQLQSRGETLDSEKGLLVDLIRELEQFKQLAPSIYNKIVEQEGTGSGESGAPATVSQMRLNLESGKAKFDMARQEKDIDPAAPDNYKVIEAEFHRLQDEYKRTSFLFEQDQERTDALKDKLETTIHMRVLEIKQRFKSYMGLFQFEGEIEWEQYERKGRTHFQLFIKARKEGHRGTLEDVSVKARGGKVGKGVSGGEESLSSLLFALALLQNLQTAPGFIIMDEFDSALDEQRKLKVFELYGRELQRKLVILTPKSHEASYLDRFSKAYIVHHNPAIPRSKVVGVMKKPVQ